MVTGFLNANQATSKGERALYQAGKDLNWRESGGNTTAFGLGRFPRPHSLGQSFSPHAPAAEPP